MTNYLKKAIITTKQLYTIPIKDFAQKFLSEKYSINNIRFEENLVKVEFTINKQPAFCEISLSQFQKVFPIPGYPIKYQFIPIFTQENSQFLNKSEIIIETIK